MTFEKIKEVASSVGWQVEKFGDRGTIQVVKEVKAGEVFKFYSDCESLVDDVIAKNAEFDPDVHVITEILNSDIPYEEFPSVQILLNGAIEIGEALEDLEKVLKEAVNSEPRAVYFPDGTTVSDLIKILGTFPQDAEAMVNGEYGGWVWTGGGDFISFDSADPASFDEE